MNLKQKIQTVLIFSLSGLVIGLLPLIFIALKRDLDDYIITYLLFTDIIGLSICRGFCESYGFYAQLYLLPLSLLLIGLISSIIFITHNKSKEKINIKIGWQIFGLLIFISVILLMNIQLQPIFVIALFILTIIYFFLVKKKGYNSIKMIGSLIILTFTLPIINKIPSNFYYGINFDYQSIDELIVLIPSIISSLIALYLIYKTLKINPKIH